MTTAAKCHRHHYRRHHYRNLIVNLIAVFFVATTAVVYVAAAFEHHPPSSFTRRRDHRRRPPPSPRDSCIGKSSCGTTFGKVTTTRASQNDDGDDDQTSTTTSSSPKVAVLGRQQGVYTRPSAAIERGSGFFVPGLEGAKVRLAVGSVLLLLAAVNHFLSSTTTTTSTSGNTLAEGLAVLYSLLVLVQAAIEYTKDDLALKNGPASTSSSSTNTGGSRGGALKATAAAAKAASSSSFQQQWAIPLENDDAINWKDQVEWSAQTYLSLTPATNIMLIGPGKVIYRLGKSNHRLDDDNDGNGSSQDEKEEAEACESALQLLSQSKSGRLSLPALHPIAVALVPPKSSLATTTTTARTVVLQRISTQSKLAFLVSSNQLLVSFTPQDLTWLGQLARNVNPNG